MPAGDYRQNRKAPRPGIEPGLQEPESDADPSEPNILGTEQQSTGKRMVEVSSEMALVPLENLVG